MPLRTCTIYLNRITKLEDSLVIFDLSTHHEQEGGFEPSHEDNCNCATAFSIYTSAPPACIAGRSSIVKLTAKPSP